MALKDWKKNKLSSSIRVFYNKNPDLQLEILAPQYFHTDTVWKVWVYRFWSSDKIENVAFKTKSQALKFAKSYMRTH